MSYLKFTCKQQNMSYLKFTCKSVTTFCEVIASFPASTGKAIETQAEYRLLLSSFVLDSPFSATFLDFLSYLQDVSSFWFGALVTILTEEDTSSLLLRPSLQLYLPSSSTLISDKKYPL